MNVKIERSKAAGTVTAPPSKSMAHRLLVCAGLAAGESIVGNIAPSQDVLATLDCLRALGVACRITGNSVAVRGLSPENFKKGAVLLCRESGTTLRFLIPLALLLENETRFTGSARLFERPLSAFADLCRERGLTFAPGVRELAVKGVTIRPSDQSRVSITDRKSLM